MHSFWMNSFLLSKAMNRIAASNETLRPSQIGIMVWQENRGPPSCIGSHEFTKRGKFGFPIQLCIGL